MKAGLAAVLFLGGCEEITDALDTATPSGEMLSETTDSKTSSNDGVFTVQVDVPSDGTAFLVTSVARGDYDVTLETITDPGNNVVLDWQDWVSGTETLTDSFFVTGPVGVSQWPIRKSDGPLVPGTWKVKFDTLQNYRYAGNVDCDTTTMIKRDPDFTTGTVSARIVWAEGVDQNPGLQEAMDAAVLRWQDIWGGAGITLDVTYATSNIDPELSFGSAGGVGIENAANDGTGHDLQVIVGDYIQGQHSLFGLAAGIPGSVVPTERTFVLLSWLVHSGPNGEFDDDEIRIMGETLAHEPGHFSGLAHPVEIGYNYWDAISDTEKCTSQSACEDALGHNVMFPYPVCTGYTNCEPQGQLTADQASIMNQYLAAL